MNIMQMLMRPIGGGVPLEKSAELAALRHTGFFEGHPTTNRPCEATERPCENTHG